MADAIARKPQQLYYHGTTDKFLRSILKHGLVPRELGDRVWKDDDNVSFHQVDRTSYGGTYFASRLGTATSSAGHAVRKLGGNELIVCALLQPASAQPDEDSYTYVIDHALAAAFSKVWRVIVVDSSVVSVYLSILTRDPQLDSFLSDYQRNSKSDVEQSLASMEEAFCAHLREEWHPSHPKFDAIASEVFRAAIVRKAAHVSWSTFSYQLTRYFSDSAFDHIELPDKAEAERQYRAAVEALMRVTRESTRPDPRAFNHTIRMTEPVGFSGRNRIVAVISIPYNTKERPVPVTVVWGQAPPDFEQQYNQTWGPRGTAWEFADALQTMKLSAALERRGEPALADQLSDRKARDEAEQVFHAVQLWVRHNKDALAGDDWNRVDPRMMLLRQNIAQIKDEGWAWVDGGSVIIHARSAGADCDDDFFVWLTVKGTNPTLHRYTGYMNATILELPTLLAPNDLRYADTRMSLDSFVHEYIHHLDFKRGAKPGGRYSVDPHGDGSGAGERPDYWNDPMEMNAYYQEALRVVDGILEKTPLEYRDRIRQNLMGNSVEHFIDFVMRKLPRKMLEHLTADNKRRLQKRIAVYYQTAQEK